MILSVYLCAFVALFKKKRKETLIPVAWTGEVDAAGGIGETGKVGEGDS